MTHIFIESGQKGSNESNFIQIAVSLSCGGETGGFAKRQEYLLSLKEKHNIDFSLFLFPDSHDDGMFETLLARIINPKYSAGDNLNGTN